MTLFSSNEILNWPNAISVTRILLLAPVLYGLSRNVPLITSTTFAAIIASDVLDGWVARKFNHPNQYGTLVDHGADATVVSILSIYFAQASLITWALPVLIATAFLHYAFDAHGRNRRTTPLNASSKNSTNSTLGPRPSSLGRINGISYFVFIGSCISLHHCRYYLSADSVALASIALGIGAWILVATTSLSIWQRSSWL